mmetsp:Transcript_24800/g.67575  ORF Transcript_24800/g.67575 Transcript_24800/m.67575 type:complete len:80 (+) Transcript_24800:1016-1255(+)
MKIHAKLPHSLPSLKLPHAQLLSPANIWMNTTQHHSRRKRHMGPTLLTSSTKAERISNVQPRDWQASVIFLPLKAKCTV